MRIDVYLVSGSHHSFEQTDAQASQENLGRLWPEELFTNPTVSICGDAYWTAFPSAAIARIEVTYASLPEWPVSRNIDGIALLEKDDFEARRAGDDVNLSEAAAEQPFTAHAELEDCTGTTHYIEVSGRTLPHVARARGLERLLESPCIVARRGDDTAVLINPVNLTAVQVAGAGASTSRTIKADRL